MQVGHGEPGENARRYYVRVVEDRARLVRALYIQWLRGSSTAMPGRTENMHVDAWSAYVLARGLAFNPRWTFVLAFW